MKQARRWVIRTITDIGRPELAETAELGTSELVTNAMLHATDPITVRVRGTPEHPRIEVRDGSIEPPLMPVDLSDVTLDEVDEEELLKTFGRGLDIVARCADAWGVEIEDNGKILWFAPAPAPRDDALPGRVSGLPPPQPDADADAIHVCLLGAPIRALAAFEAHYRELRREVRLLALAHGDEYPIAKSLADLFGTLQRELRVGLEAAELQLAHREGRTEVDVMVPVSPRKAETMGQFVKLLDFADSFCRQHRLQSLARTPEQVDFQTWFFTEFVRQKDGLQPLRWEDAQAQD